jgi:8-oxo-dGTP pyrophosphatase MutT (NUDIX family)
MRQVTIAQIKGNRMDPVRYDNKWLKIRQNGDYMYAERKGVHSIAFILYDDNQKKFGLVSEFKPPLNVNLVTAFGGSFDGNLSEIEHSPRATFLRELEEESGYLIDTEVKARVYFAGEHFVSTQMNQFCYCFLADVTDLPQGERKPQNAYEEAQRTIWASYETLMLGPCWKAKVIATSWLQR